MTEYAWPAVLRPSRLSCYLQHNALRFVSPVTGATEELRSEGARWVAEARRSKEQFPVGVSGTNQPLVLKVPNALRTRLYPMLGFQHSPLRPAPLSVGSAPLLLTG